MFNEEDFLQFSGLQHFKFCRRQWVLIHVENLWAENFRTTDGAMCLEETLCCEIPAGALYYGEIRRHREISPDGRPPAGGSGAPGGDAPVL